jgi:GT2 family glycosyltransferase/glycosyltransferase involved in cell wall biosynthesis
MLTANPLHPRSATDRDARLLRLVRTSALQALRHALQWNGHPAAARYLSAVLDALQTGTLDSALRLVDAAWRSLPDSSGILAPIYGRLLALQDQDADAALRLLRRVGEPDPDIAALIVHALLQLRRDEEARRELQRALAQFYVAPSGLLAQIAGQLLNRPYRASGSKGGAAAEVRFGLDGRAEARGAIVSGWVRLGWQPSRRLRVRVEDETGARRVVPIHRVARQGWCWPFTIDLRRAGISGNQVVISAQLPDGRWQPLPDAPLLRESALRLPVGRSQVLPRWRSGAVGRQPGANLKPPPGIDVIIPVYQGRQETLSCIDSVLATISPGVSVIVVDDATEDAQLAGALDTLASDNRITLLRNATNLGFVASVNRALAVHQGNDVVLLNSDTQVFGDWVARLRKAAYSGPRVGTVTPFTNSGSIAGYPRAGEQPMSPEDAAVLQTHAAEVNAGRSVEIPVGVGFCLYVRRDCLLATGALDAAVFGSGYGEEVDFCLRARWLGWSHRLAADVFVYHLGGVSFGVRRAALLDRSDRLLELRHPGFGRFVGEFIAQDPLRSVRRRLDEQRLVDAKAPFVLLLTVALPGGVERFVNERCAQFRARGQIPLLLRPQRAGSIDSCELWCDGIETPNLRYDIPAELPALVALLARLKIAAVELQHFLHLDPRIVEAVRAFGTPYDVFVHDYAWICPRVTLIDESGRYCGEPAVTVCAVCVKRNGSELVEAISVAALRRRSDDWLRGARRVIAPSADTSDRLRRYFPDVDIQVQPRAEPPLSSPVEPRASRPQTRVALIGAIGEHKGYQVVLECARDARRRGLPLEYVVIGYTPDDAPLVRTGKVFVTGPYAEGEVQHLLRRERPDVVFLSSVWPETWSYTLDEALGAGLQVVAFDLGAISQRLRAAGQGVLLPVDLNARQINDRLLKLARGKSVKQRSVEQTKSPGDPAQRDSLAASVQILPLPAGLYLFSVTAGPAPRAAGALQLPALHVGLGPGVRAGQVEFTAGPTTEGAWLFATTDLLVIRVNGSGTTLMLTSVKGPGGEALSIKVERLDSRSEPTPVMLPSTAQPASKGGPKAGGGSDKRRDAMKPNGADDAPLTLPLRVGAHIRSRGDMTFAEVPWAGRVAPGLWIESFSVRPLVHLDAADIQYKGLTGSGFETPWVSDDAVCGTQGMSVPLVGFAVRLKASPATARYDCEYSGYFKSGLTVGPLRNGAPCRSTVANDPLEGLQIRILRRVTATTSAPAPRSTSARSTSKAAKPVPATQRAAKPTKASRRK